MAINYRENLLNLGENECAYFFCNNIILEVQKRADFPDIREIEGCVGQMFDFVNGRCDDPSIKSLDEMYASINTKDLICAVTPYGYDATGDILLYLSQKRRLENMKPNVEGLYNIGIQTKNVNAYRARLDSMGSAFLIATRKELPNLDFATYHTAANALRASVERMEAAANGECFVVSAYHEPKLGEPAQGPYFVSGFVFGEKQLAYVIDEERMQKACYLSSDMRIVRAVINSKNIPTPTNTHTKENNYDER